MARKIKVECFDDYKSVIALEIDRDVTSVSKANAEEIVTKFKDHKYIYARIRHDTFPRESDVLEVGVKYPKVVIVSEDDVSNEMNYRTSYTLGHE